MLKKKKEINYWKKQETLYSPNSYMKSVISTTDLTVKVFDTQISPIIEYASEDWYNERNC